MFMGNHNNTLMYHLQYSSVFELSDTEMYAENMTILRKNLENMMALKSWNAYDLAEASGVPQPTIQRFLKNKIGDPRAETVRKLAKGLGTTEQVLRGFGNNASEKRKAINGLMDRLSEDQINNLEAFITSILSDSAQKTEQTPLTPVPENVGGGEVNHSESRP